MADESNNEITEATTPTEIVPPKKREGAKAKKASITAPAEAPNAVKAVRGGTKKAVKSVASTASTKSTAKSVARARVAKQTTAPPPADLDDIADLLKLEEENARLRKTLAEKLRAENAGLRKRLGIS